MFDWENDFVQELKKENKKETQQTKYKAIKKSLKDGSETWASLERTLQSEGAVALDAAWPQLSSALELEDEVHKAAVTQAVTASLDEQVLNPMRKWLTEQIALDPSTMLEDADENGAAQAVRVLNRSASIESASTVGETHAEDRGDSMSRAAEEDTGSARDLLGRQIDCLFFLSSRLHMAIRDCSFLDKDVEQKSKELEAYVERMLTRGRKEGAKEKAQRTALDVERETIWAPVERYLQLIEPPVQRFAKAAAQLANARVTQDAIGRIPDAVLWGTCGWKLSEAHTLVDDVALKWQTIKETTRPEVWAALEASATNQGLLGRVESGVDTVVTLVPKIDGLIGGSRQPMAIDEVLNETRAGGRERRATKLGGLSQALSGLSPQQIKDAALVGKLILDLRERVHVINSSSLWFVQEELARVTLGIPEPEPTHAYDVPSAEEALEELLQELPKSSEDLPADAGSWEEAGHAAMLRLQELGRRAREVAGELDASAAVQPVADWLYAHAEAALDVLDDPCEPAAREWVEAFLNDQSAPDAEAFAAAMRRTRPRPEGAINVRELTRQRGTFRFLRGLHVLLLDGTVRLRAAGVLGTVFE